jgi:hypothetical protein
VRGTAGAGQQGQYRQLGVVAAPAGAQAPARTGPSTAPDRPRAKAMADVLANMESTMA